MTPVKKPLLVIVGPTASGKTEVAVELGLQLNGEVVSADSMLVYKGMDIGTAKPTLKERQGVAHHLIDVVEPDDYFSVAQYQQLAETVISDIHKRNKLPIIVGGTGLYVRAVMDHYNFDTPGEDKELRQQLMELSIDRGKLWLHQELNNVDPVAAEQIHPNNVRRVIRALEVYQLTGMRFSDMKQADYQTNAKYNAAIFGLNHERDLLYERINKRVDLMVTAGLVEEVSALLDKGFKRSATSMQGLGYKEIAAHLDGELSLHAAIELLKRDTRRYAKRQFTWFRRDPRIHWIDRHNHNITQIIKDITDLWQEKHF